MALDFCVVKVCLVCVCFGHFSFQSCEYDQFSKEVWKSNFRQYGQLKKQSREAEKEDEKQRREVKSEERRCNCAKVSRKKIHTRKMLGKSRNALFFP